MALDLSSIRSETAAAEAVPTPGKETAARPSPRFGFPGRRTRVSLDDLATFTRQLSLLLSTGNSLAPSLAAIAGQFRESSLGPILDDVRQRLEEGIPFTACLRQHPRTFDQLFVSIIEAGEAAGALRDCLDHLASMIDSQRRLRSRIREAMTYPIILTVIMTIVLGVLFGFMLPRFREIFSGMESELPWITAFLLDTSELVRSRWQILLPIFAVVVVAARRIGDLPVIGRLADEARFRLPIVRTLYRETYLFRMFLSLGLLIRSRVPMLEAIRITRGTIQSRHYDGFFAELMNGVEQGRGLARTFAKASFLPDAVKLMIATGESSGALDSVMVRLSERYLEDLESDIRRFSSAIEPAMLLVMGILVATVAFALILPLFKLSGTMH